MKFDPIKPFGDIMKTDLPLDKYGAPGFNLTERFDFSGHKSGKITPHLNTEITDFDHEKISRKYNDLTNTQLPGLNDYQFGAKKYNDLVEKNLNSINIIPIQRMDSPQYPNPLPTSINDPIHIVPLDRNNVDSNGYGLGESTSLGYIPNPKPDSIQPGGMLTIINDAPIQPLQSTIAGTSSNGYFAPNLDFMKPLK